MKPRNKHRRRPLGNGKRSIWNDRGSQHEESREEKQQKQLEYATARKTMIGLGNGQRTLNIASLNPDSMREVAPQQEIIKGLARNRIHIAAIQSTHITQDRSYLMGNYRIIEAVADKNEAAGTVSG